MPGVTISVRSNIKEISKNLSALAYKQVDFAASRALTQLAKEVQAAEKENLKRTFKHPKPFTVNAIGMRGATKRMLEAKVFVKPVAAKYLRPYETGGVHVLPGQALLNPKDVRLNQYGQLSRGTMKRLKGRSDIYIGPIETKHGKIDGVWQRTKAKKGNPSRLRLLIRFGDALPVNERLNYGEHAKALIDRRFNAVFGAAMAKAVATAR